MLRTLYLCYFGLRQPLVQTQVLPYLRQLSAGGVSVTLLTFEPEMRRSWSDADRREARQRLKAEGIDWLIAPYHKRPSVPATLYDIIAGARLAANLVRRERIDVIHARSHVPMAMALLARQWTGCRTIFDIRGLLAEEYADAGIWAAGSPAFRAVKWVERAGVRNADRVVVLTDRMRDWLVSEGLAAVDKVEVIPCCVDFARFDAARGSDRPGAPDETNPAGRFELVYAGAVSGLYLLDEIAHFFLAIRALRRDAFLRILTVGDTRKAAARLETLGVERSLYAIGSARPEEVPGYLRAARAGLSFRKPTFSQIAASPTKVAEYLAAGIPVVCSGGVGDTDRLVTDERVGVVLQSFDPAAHAAAATELVALCAEPAVRDRCLRAATTYFDLTHVGSARYRRVYEQIQHQLQAC